MADISAQEEVSTLSRCIVDTEWYYSVGGEQIGPVSWDALKRLVSEKKITAGDLVWNASMPEWVEAQTVAGLVPQVPAVRKPPPLPAKANSTPETETPALTTGHATFEIILDPFTGEPTGEVCPKVRFLFNEFICNNVSCELRDGFRVKFPQQVATGKHLIKLAPRIPFTGLAKLLFLFGMYDSAAPKGERRYRVEFPTPGHYTIRFVFDEPRSDDDYPSDVVVTKEGGVPQDVGIAGWWRGINESSRRKKLHALWRQVGDTGLWFMFTKDGAMLRQDGLVTKFRWLNNETVELYEAEDGPTVKLQILSLSDSELIIKTGGQSGHFYRNATITQAVERERREEAEEAMRGFALGAAKVAGAVAAALVVGGIAILCSESGSSRSLADGSEEPGSPASSSGTKKHAAATGSAKEIAPRRTKAAHAVCGAVIVGSDGRTFSYKKRCDCGHVEPGQTNSTIPSAGSVINTSFSCSKCGRMQEVRIQGSDA